MRSKHRVLKTVALSLAVVLVVVLTGGFFVYRHLNNNITGIDITDALGTDRPAAVKKETPQQPLNILLLGSDTREGQTGHIGGDTPGLSDTTILLHISGDRKLAYGVSLPRDAMVERPTCERKDGNGTDPGGLSMFNAAYAVGGPACTIKTVEKLTNVRINHFVVIDFNGFRKMVDALGGVEVCVPKEVNDTTGHITLPAGTYNVKGQRALDYVRVRHVISDNGDIGRMKRQQTFLASMANKAVSAGTLANPVRLVRFLDAATKSLTTDTGLSSLQKLGGLAKSLQGVGLDQVQFLTVPFESYEPDPNRLQWAPGADRLWYRIRNDMPINKRFASEVTTAAKDPSASASPKPGASSTPSPSADPSTDEAAAAKAAENGLCA
ncbi:LCP family protein [Nocardioides panacis]|uniref:LCP family protein n=1 Tax=Nocardioides panacis TaxID=2849501 RepID=A0A975SYI7_9ACTN|nr:LCP family protein [Nocardioides panacis]QWZ08309.1 LCP family protein [Nocardioides panacis]QWZ08336.1 LCP family protein [Nocardioides panacis]